MPTCRSHRELSSEKELNETEICNYADDTTIYCSHKELHEVTLRLEKDTVELSNWFAENFMKLNEE